MHVILLAMKHPSPQVFEPVVQTKLVPSVKTVVYSKLGLSKQDVASAFGQRALGSEHEALHWLVYMLIVEPVKHLTRSAGKQYPEGGEPPQFICVLPAPSVKGVSGPVAPVQAEAGQVHRIEVIVVLPGTALQVIKSATGQAFEVHSVPHVVNVSEPSFF